MQRPRRRKLLKNLVAAARRSLVACGMAGFLCAATGVPIVVPGSASASEGAHQSSVRVCGCSATGGCGGACGCCQERDEQSVSLAPDHEPAKSGCCQAKAAAAASQAKASCCSRAQAAETKPACCKSQRTKDRVACKSTESTTDHKFVLVIGSLAQKCRGLTMAWVALGGAVPVSTLSCLLDNYDCGGVSDIVPVSTSRFDVPPVPPPRG
jgi:hypothetical protein